MITFVDFKKAYDSVDGRTLFNILEEFGTDQTDDTRGIFEQNLNKHKSIQNFSGNLTAF